MKFLADMGISPKSTQFLREQGYDALHLLDEQLGRLPDPEILEKARVERRVLLTHDLDFAELVAASGTRLPSVVIFRLRSMRPENVNRHLSLMLAQYGDALEQGVIISVNDGQFRSRKLPI